DSLFTWQTVFWNEIQSLLNRIGKQPIQILWIGNDYQAVEGEEFFWKTITDSIRFNYPKLRIGYTARTSRIEKFKSWQYFDVIGIQYEIPPDRNYKQQAKIHHLQISKIADSLQKDLWITNLNLLEQDKLLQCKNALRFWQPKPLNGLIVNSIYPISPLTDTLTRFGLEKRTDVIEYLQMINNRKKLKN
ncbi:MAG: hypothetical protein NZ108_07140, partial [Bacteroidia bacterium]|nr:hypothetical protein [Bacteroidia bacterium]